MTDWFSVMVPQAHELGISVFAVLDLFHAPLSDHRQESRVLLYDPTRRKVHSWTQFDLLARRFSRNWRSCWPISEKRVDGMVFRARAENSLPTR